MWPTLLLDTLHDYQYYLCIFNYVHLCGGRVDPIVQHVTRPIRYKERGVRAAMTKVAQKCMNRL